MALATGLSKKVSGMALARILHLPIVDVACSFCQATTDWF
jgi:hypothetical protein